MGLPIFVSPYPREVVPPFQLLRSSHYMVLRSDEEEKKKIATEALEIVYHRLRLWYQDLDRRTDIILARDISTLSDQELEVFYNLNDLSLDIGRIFSNVCHASSSKRKA